MLLSERGIAARLGLTPGAIVVGNDKISPIVSAGPLVGFSFYIVYDVPSTDTTNWVTLMTLYSRISGDGGGDFPDVGAVSFSRRGGATGEAVAHERFGTSAGNNQTGINNTTTTLLKPWAVGRHVFGSCYANGLGSATHHHIGVGEDKSEARGSLAAGNGIERKLMKLRSANSSTAGADTTAYGVPILGLYFDEAHDDTTRNHIMTTLAGLYNVS